MRTRKCGFKVHGQSKRVEEIIADKKYQQNFKRWKASEVGTIPDKNWTLGLIEVGVNDR